MLKKRLNFLNFKKTLGEHLITSQNWKINIISHKANELLNNLF
jgi:hypothetical protein